MNVSIAQKTAAKQAQQAKNTQAAANRAAARAQRQAANNAKHLAAIQAHENAVALKKQKQALKNQANYTPASLTNSYGNPMPTTAGDTSLNSPDQGMVTGGYQGTNIGTNDTGGITLGNGTGDTTTPPKTGLTTIEYVAIGAALLLVVLFVVRHHNG